MAALSVVAICTTGLIGWIRGSLAHERIAWVAAAKGSEEELARQIVTLSAFSDAELAAFRSKAKKYRSHLGPESTWNELGKKVGGAWSIESGAKVENSGSTIERGILVRSSPTVADWQDAVDTVGSLELMPGVTVLRFEMRTSGDLEHRSVDLLKIEVESRIRRAQTDATLQ